MKGAHHQISCYCPDSKVPSILCVCTDCTKAEALDAGENVVSGLDPAERLWVGICGLDIDFDSGFELAHGAEHAAPDGSLGQQREEAFDLVEPGSRCRREVSMPARTLGKPVADQLGLVRAVVVHDDVDIEIGGHIALDLVEELAELLRTVPGHTWAKV